MDILSSRILLRPSDLDRTRRFCRDVLRRAIYREFGPPEDLGVEFFLDPGMLEVSGAHGRPPGHSVMIWTKVWDVPAEHARLAAAGVPVIRGPLRSLGLDRNMDPGPRWHPDRPGRGSRRSSSPS